MKAIRNQKGFTLTEVLVSLLILSIVAALASSMLLSSTGTYDKTTQGNLDKLVADELYKEVSEKLLYATKLTVAISEAGKPRPADGNFRCLQVKDGRLYLDGKDTFGESFYHGRTLAVTAKAYDSSKLSLTVQLLDQEGKEAYRTGSTITMLNIQLANSSIQGTVGQEMENPLFYFSYDETIKPK